MRSFLANLSWVAAANILVKPIWFVFITFVCIRFLGVGGYGQMTAALALLSIVDGSLMMGTTPHTIREVARDPDSASSFLASFLPSRALFSALATLIAVGIAVASGSENSPAIILAAGAYVMLRNLSEYCRALFTGRQLFKYEAGSTFVEKLSSVIGGSVFLLQSPTIASVFLGMSAGMLVVMTLNIWWLARIDIRLSSTNRSTAFVKKNLKIAFPLGLAAMFVLLLYRTDSIMLESMSGALEAGQYAIAFRITEACVMLPTLLTTVLLPKLSELHGSDRQVFRRASISALLVMGAIAVVVSSGIGWFAEPIVRLMDNSVDAEPAAALLQWLIWTFPFNSMNFVFVTIMTAHDEHRRIAWVLGSAAVLNITLNVILIPEHGAWGATAATLATQAVILVLFTWSWIRIAQQHAGQE